MLIDSSVLFAPFPDFDRAKVESLPFPLFPMVGEKVGKTAMDEMMRRQYKH